jgi:hypothetical protein
MSTIKKTPGSHQSPPFGLATPPAARTSQVSKMSSRYTNVLQLRTGRQFCASAYLFLLRFGELA